MESNEIYDIYDIFIKFDLDKGGSLSIDEL